QRRGASGTEIQQPRPPLSRNASLCAARARVLQPATIVSDPRSTMNRITKAVFPVAGLGTRFLPATKASPKEMMPIVDKPLIQHAVEEAISAGISEMIFVT